MCPVTGAALAWLCVRRAGGAFCGRPAQERDRSALRLVLLIADFGNKIAPKRADDRPGVRYYAQNPRPRNTMTRAMIRRYAVAAFALISTIPVAGAQPVSTDIAARTELHAT